MSDHPANSRAELEARLARLKRQTQQLAKVTQKLAAADLERALTEFQKPKPKKPGTR